MMNDHSLFNSLTAPIPRIRPDLDIIPIENNGNAALYFHDMRGYVPSNFALDDAARGLLSLLNGHKSIQQLQPYLSNGTTGDRLLQYVQFLDENRLLHSPHFKVYAEQVEQKYERASVHHSVTAGQSYPEDPQELHAYLDEAFAADSAPPDPSASTPKALYAPHIDPRVGLETYVQSFRKIQHLRPKRVVVLATSHYAGLYPDTYKNTPFIVSRKNISMPLGPISADRAAIDRLIAGMDAHSGVTANDRAHRIEHSIELHLLFLQYCWPHEFTIVPILVGGFDELFYASESHLRGQVEEFSRQLAQQFGKDEETFFLISGDLAHTGKKFGDSEPASTLKDRVKQFDASFLAYGAAGATQKMLQLMKRDFDPYRICGFPPLYTFLNSFPNLNGQTLCYDRWDQTEQESAVTYGSVLYQSK